jgi:general secretion pathway protein L
VLDGLLEEHLLDDPEALHFALEPDAKAGAPVWVAACNRIWLRSIVQGLEAAGRRVVRIVPEFAPQPADGPPLLQITGEPEAPQLTVCDADGVVSLPLAGAGLALSGSLPLDTAVITTEPAVAEAAEHLLERRVPIVQAPQRWLRPRARRGSSRSSTSPPRAARAPARNSPPCCRRCATHPNGAPRAGASSCCCSPS